MNKDVSGLFIMFALIPLNLFSQSYVAYHTGSTSDTITGPEGGICLMGGATEHVEAMKWFLERSKGGDVLVLRASGEDGYNDYMYNGLGVNINSVETIVCNSPAASDEPYIHQKIKQAEAIWFAGGDQWDYVSYWRNTAVDSLINDAIINRNIVIGGTSAGMAIQGRFYFNARHGTVTSAEALSDPYNSKMMVDSARFLQNYFLRNVITDTHYDDPDRSGRHVAFMARILTDWGTDVKGIAADAYSAICIDTTGLAHCYGDYPRSNDYLYFLQTNCESARRRPENCIPGSPLEWYSDSKAIRVYKVNGSPSGERTFNLKDWRTGNGGSWENWYVSNGVLSKSQGNIPDCRLPTTIEPGLKQQLMILYPNPVTGGHLNLDYPYEGIIQICIFDINGRIVRKIQGNLMNDNIIDTSELVKGIYFLLVETETDTMYLKFIVI
jgi:cyanophycinase-like exopeptidase